MAENYLLADGTDALDIPSSSESEKRVFDWRSFVGKRELPVGRWLMDETQSTDGDRQRPEIGIEDYAGVEALSERIEYSQVKKSLRKVILGMKGASWSWDGSDPEPICPKSLDTALSVLENLSFPRPLPKLAPDGEGDILFVWDEGDETALLTIEQELLHLVKNPGTDRAQHIDNIRFRLGKLPSRVNEHLPEV